MTPPKKPRQTRRGFGRLRQRPSGRWQAAYTGPDGKLYRAPRTFDAQDRAIAWLAAERKLIDLDEWLPPDQRGQKRRPKRVTFGDYSAKWLDGRTLKPRTRAHYRRTLDAKLLPTFGDLPLTAIDRDLVELWHSRGSATPTYTSHAYSLLRTIMSTAVDEGLLGVSPCHIRGAGSVRRVHKIEPLSIAELEVLVAAMPEKYRLLILLATWCALRFGELAELRRKDIDLTNGVIHVRRGVVRVDGELLVGTPKSEAGRRDVAIPPHLMPLVREHLDTHSAPGRDGLVFPARSGGQLASSTLYGRRPTKVDGKWKGGSNFYRARVVAGRPDLHLHDCRHTGAVLAAQTGATLAELMSRLGHSTPAAAMRYQHAARGRDAEIAAALSKMATDEA